MQVQIKDNEVISKNKILALSYLIISNNEYGPTPSFFLGNYREISQVVLMNYNLYNECVWIINDLITYKQKATSECAYFMIVCVHC